MIYFMHRKLPVVLKTRNKEKKKKDQLRKTNLHMIQAQKLLRCIISLELECQLIA